LTSTNGATERCGWDNLLPTITLRWELSILSHAWLADDDSVLDSGLTPFFSNALVDKLRATVYIPKWSFIKMLRSKNTRIKNFNKISIFIHNLNMAVP
jgi:hypothetical protein